MVTQIVEVSQDGHHLSKYRGFMTLKKDRNEVARIPLDDITTLILSAHQITLSKALMVELAERNTPIMICGKNFHPLAFSLPYDTHFDQTGILWSQIECRPPLAKRLWQSVVKEKIANQRLILEYFTGNTKATGELDILIKRVKSGDPDNMEAQAARHYWTALFGKDFRRDHQTGPANALLNYGYSILRAATARAICGSGLTPALGIHHHNRKNPFALVDDLMEPYRPLVDKIVRQIIDDDMIEDDPLSPTIKQQLTKILDMDIEIDKGISTVMNGLYRLAQTFVISLQEKENKLEFARLKPVGKLL